MRWLRGGRNFEAPELDAGEIDVALEKHVRCERLERHARPDRAR
jgi:hypothetical protein